MSRTKTTCKYQIAHKLKVLGIMHYINTYKNIQEIKILYKDNWNVSY
jgi:hypothetical protein